MVDQIIIDRELWEQDSTREITHIENKKLTLIVEHVNLYNLYLKKYNFTKHEHINVKNLHIYTNDKNKKISLSSDVLDKNNYYVFYTVMNNYDIDISIKTVFYKFIDEIITFIYQTQINENEYKIQVISYLDGSYTYNEFQFNLSSQKIINLDLEDIPLTYGTILDESDIILLNGIYKQRFSSKEDAIRFMCENKLLKIKDLKYVKKIFDVIASL